MIFQQNVRICCSGSGSGTTGSPTIHTHTRTLLRHYKKAEIVSSRAGYIYFQDMAHVTMMFYYGYFHTFINFFPSVGLFVWYSPPLRTVPIPHGQVIALCLQNHYGTPRSTHFREHYTIVNEGMEKLIALSTSSASATTKVSSNTIAALEKLLLDAVKLALKLVLDKGIPAVSGKQMSAFVTRFKALRALKVVTGRRLSCRRDQLVFLLSRLGDTFIAPPTSLPW